MTTVPGNNYSRRTSLGELLREVQVPSKTDDEWQKLENDLMLRLDAPGPAPRFRFARDALRPGFAWAAVAVLVFSVAGAGIAISLVKNGAGAPTASIVSIRGAVAVAWRGKGSARTITDLAKAPTRFAGPGTAISTPDNSSAIVRLDKGSVVELLPGSRLRARKGRPFAARRAARLSQPAAPRRTACLAAWREFGRELVAAAVDRALYPTGDRGSRDHRHARIGAAARRAAAGGRVSPISAAGRAAFRRTLSRPLAARFGAVRRIRNLAQFRRRRPRPRRALGAGQRTHLRDFRRTLARRAGGRRRQALWQDRPLPRARRRKRRAVSGTWRAPGDNRRQSEIRRARRRRPIR